MNLNVVILLRRAAAWPAAIWIVASLLSGAGSYGQSAPATTSTTTATDDLPRLIQELGDDDYAVREAATARILALGQVNLDELRARLNAESDTEIRFRLRFIIENLQPPERAALIVRADPAGRFSAGELITHVNNRPVRGRADLVQRVRESRSATVRVRGTGGPRDVPLITADDLPQTCDYQAPRGATIAQTVRLYATGYAERANELLATLDDSCPQTELSPLLRAVLAYTAGDANAATRLLADHPDAAEPLSSYAPWYSPSALDLAGPEKAPYYLEWRLWEREGASSADARNDPDVSTQRVLVPAGRFEDALVRVGGLWWSRYRTVLGAPSQSDRDRVAGNLLAVSSWMLSELDLQSEALRLIEPRSVILRGAVQGVHKWLRVQTDAWLPFFAGDPRAALDGFYEDARLILQPPGPPASRAVIQNPRVAAMIAFFAYQFPSDERITELLNLVNQPGSPALTDYARWMLYAVRAENYDVIREHLLKMLPNMPADTVADFVRAAALLEYVRDRPDEAVFDALRDRLGDCPDEAQHRQATAMIDALAHLATGNAAEALALLRSAADEPGIGVLRSTADFLTTFPTVVSAAGDLHAPLLAVPIGSTRDTWLVLTRARRLVRSRPITGEVTPVDSPSPTWFPGPLTWPWLGREESTGRVWTYDRRRVTEIAEPGAASFSINLHTSEIAPFDQYVGPVWSVLAGAAAGTHPDTNAGEFWPDDVRVGLEYTVDPALPELAFIHVLPEDPRIAHVALRGGPHVLIDVSSGKSWTSAWIAEHLFVANSTTTRPQTPLWFLAQAAREHATPVVFLMSSAGLIRFDVATEQLTPVDLPGDDPHAPVIPESCPYDRHDPRWIYCARLPDAGGKIFRIAVADNHVDALDMVNMALPRTCFLMQSRAALRGQIDALFAAQGMPPLPQFVADSAQSVARMNKENQP